MRITVIATGFEGDQSQNPAQQQAATKQSTAQRGGKTVGETKNRGTEDELQTVSWINRPRTRKPDYVSPCRKGGCDPPFYQKGSA